MTAAEVETSTKLRQKISYLQRLLTLRLRFMKYATGVDVTFDDKTVYVKWDTKKGGRYFDEETIEFPVEHLGRRILHYRAKFRAEFKTRHNASIHN